MKKFLLILPTLLLLVTPLLAQGNAGKNTNASYESYIRKYAPIAVKHMQEYGIPASITLAQGLLESGAGTSDLARNANNHFGIKCHKGWTGETFHKDDDAKNECFRKYKNPEESYKDHALFLTSRERYASLFKLQPTDYKGWAKGLKTAGYATNPAYAEKLIGIIELYKLFEYDGVKKQNFWQRIFGKKGNSQPASSPIQGTVSRTIHKINRAEYIVVLEGETIQSLADSLAINPWTLRKYNDLGKTGEVKAGDRVFIQSKKNKGTTSAHTVQPGETLHSISQLHGMKLKSLTELNEVESGFIPEPGTSLKLR